MLNVLILIATLAPVITASNIDAEALYDIYKGRLSQLEKDYGKASMDFFQKDDNKRSTFKKLAKCGSLYDEFKKKLDRFNDALTVDITIDNKSAKRSSAESENSLVKTPHLDASKNVLNREGRGFFNYFGKKTADKDTTDSSKDAEKKFDAKGNNDKILKPMKIPMSPLDEDPGSIYDRYRKELNAWTGGVIFSGQPRLERNSKLGEYFIWQNIEKKKDDDADTYDIENLINQYKAEKFREKSKTLTLKKREITNEPTYKTEELIKNYAEDKIPFDTNRLSLYPLVYDHGTNLMKNGTNGNDLLMNYAKKLNTTAVELAKKLAQLDSNYIESKLMDAQAKARKTKADNNKDSTNLEAASLFVLKDISNKNVTSNRGNGRSMANLPLIRNETILVDKALPRIT